MVDDYRVRCIDNTPPSPRLSGSASCIIVNFCLRKAVYCHDIVVLFRRAMVGNGKATVRTENYKQTPSFTTRGMSKVELHVFFFLSFFAPRVDGRFCDFVFASKCLARFIFKFAGGIVLPCF